MSEFEVSGRFHWSLRCSYDYVDQLIYRDWGWEWQRRHPKFQLAWWQARDVFEIIFSDSPLAIIRVRGTVPARPEQARIKKSLGLRARK